MSTWENYSPEELIKQMSVSHWTPDRTPEEVMNQHIQNSLAQTKSARDGISNKLGISYGSEATQVFDEYGTELKDDVLIFVWIHGGYWQEGTKEIAGHMAPNLVARDVRNVVVEYSLAPKVKVAEIQEEIIQAIRKVGEMFPNAKIVVGGHSAGGQLAAMLLHNKSLDPIISERIAGLVFSSGVFDLRPLVATPLNIALGLTIETAEASSPLILKEIHPNFLSKKDTFPILLMVGEYESPEFKRQSQDYRDLLHASFPFAEVVTIAKEDHFTVVEKLAEKDSLAGIELGKFLDKFK